MIINFQDNPEDNEMLNEIKRKLGKEYYKKIIDEINEKCKKNKVESAISLISAYESDWKDKKMQKVYDYSELEKIDEKNMEL